MQQLPPPPAGYVLPPPPPYAAAIQTDAASVAETHISQLTTAMTEHYANFANSVQAKLEAQISTLEKRLAGQPPAQEGQTYKRARRQPKGPGVRNTYPDYCFTHGYRVTPGHNSATCRTKNPKHKREATMYNMLGGSTDGMADRKMVEDA